MAEHITHEESNDEAWVCICGNTPSDAGFYPIDNGNRQVEPVASEWLTGHYFCDQCGRVIDPETLRVVRRLLVNEIVRLP